MNHRQSKSHRRLIIIEPATNHHSIPEASNRPGNVVRYKVVEENKEQVKDAQASGRKADVDRRSTLKQSLELRHIETIWLRTSSLQSFEPRFMNYLMESSPNIPCSADRTFLFSVRGEQTSSILGKATHGTLCFPGVEYTSTRKFHFVSCQLGPLFENQGAPDNLRICMSS